MLRILGNSFEHFGNKGQYHIFIDTVLCRAELSNWDFAVLGTGILRNTLAVVGTVDIHLAAAIGTIEQAREGSCFAPTVRVASDIPTDFLHKVKGLLVNDRLMGMEEYRNLILENIEYDYLCREFATYREDLDEIVELMVETVCARRKTTRIAGSDFPHEVVRSRFLKLDSEHIRFVMDSLQKNTTEVRNMKQYLLTVLFNAPTTMSNHYTSQVNHDMNAGGW